MRRLGWLAALGLARSQEGGPRLEQIREHLAARRAEAGDDDFGDGFVGRRGTAFALPANAALERDVPYGRELAERMDVYRPADARDAPVVLYVHGGGWRRGDKAMPQMVANKASHWLAKGLVFVSTNYRMLPDADVIEQARGVGRALAFVQANAAAWGGDPARVILVGHSAGAHLAALLTADVGLAPSARPWLATIVLDTAALDMVAVMSRPHFAFYDPVFGRDPAFWRAASPMHRLTDKPIVPVMLVCSSRRGDSLSAAEDYAAKVSALGGRAVVLPVDLTHMQLNDQLGLRGRYTEAVDAFIESVAFPEA
ncbi:MAG: alpha/beta hydrolase [Proteobacteria bacterium]|nr:alpha/beta hydrolase [Pseudomonadota bacterium]